MVKKFLRKRSKRVKAKTRYKVEKKVREHHRKLRRVAKKRSATGSKKRSKKDPGIPRILPFRDKVVAEALEAKAQAEETRRLEKERLRAERKRAANDSRDPLAVLAKQAAERGRVFETKMAKTAEDTGPVAARERSTAAYYHDLKKVIEKSDVLLEVVDARDPIGTRCKDVEQRILSAGKRLVRVMNKIDLVPRQTAQQWLRVLQSELPCVAFKASTQTQRANLSQKRGGHFRNVVDDSANSSKCFGAESLLKILGNYCRLKDVRTSITVGVVGLPNTGKSSLINSLKRTKVCQVGAHAGVTRNLQEINLDKHIRLIDSPGVIFARHLTQEEAVLRNCINPETVGDAQPLIDVIIRRCSTRGLMLAYNLPQFEDSSEFLALMAQRWGKIKKGGVPDLNQTAKMVLRDWNSGKLGYYTEPPATMEPIVADESSAQVVSELAKEFDLDAITEEQCSALQDEYLPSDHVAPQKLDSVGPLRLPANFMEGHEDENKMEESDSNEQDPSVDMVVSTKIDEQKLLERTYKKAQRKLVKKADDSSLSEPEDGDDKMVNLKQVNRSRNLEAKRVKKAARKALERAAKASSDDEAEDHALDESDAPME